jgi:hypothetical protein
MQQKKIKKIAKFLNFKRKMKLKLKSFHVNYIHLILMFVSNIKNTSCTLLKIVYIIQVRKTWNVLNNIIIYNFIFICIVKKRQ